MDILICIELNSNLTKINSDLSKTFSMKQGLQDANNAEHGCYIISANNGEVFNVPFPHGILECFIANNDFKSQIFHAYDGKGIWHRSYWTVWSEWTQLALTSDLSNYLSLSGGQLTGNLRVGNNVELRSDNEGGNISFLSLDGKHHFEIDTAGGDYFRLYHWDKEKNTYGFHVFSDAGYASPGDVSTSSGVSLNAVYNNFANYLPTSGGILTAGGVLSGDGNVYSPHYGWLTDALNSKFPISGGDISGSMRVTGNVNCDSILRVKYIARPDTEDYGHVNFVNNVNTAYCNIRCAGVTQMSSEKVKENIQNITDEDALKLLDVNVVSFDYKENFGGKKNNFGVVAEQVKDIVPYVVTIPNNYSEDEFDEEKGINQPILSVDYTKFVPYLIKMTQIQQSKINELEERLSKLENN